MGLSSAPQSIRVQAARVLDEILTVVPRNLSSTGDLQANRNRSLLASVQAHLSQPTSRNKHHADTTARKNDVVSQYLSHLPRHQDAHDDNGSGDALLRYLLLLSGGTASGVLVPRVRFSFWCLDLLFLICSNVRSGSPIPLRAFQS
ncbi:hypothetical protein F4604DRAFT_496784 [Suillus subluteus]|nr:hypothetical protein F4604DRAFT_496784 [Suillus subluteus]